MSVTIASIPTGERPSEPGWYLAKDHDGEMLIKLLPSGEVGVMGWKQRFAVEDFTFIARIYPDRIEPAGGER